MSEVTIEQEKLAAVLQDVQGFVKLGRNLFETQFGEDIQEEVQKTASALLRAGEVAESDKDTVVRQTTLGRKATCDGLRKLARRVSALRQKVEDSPLGVGISKFAPAVGDDDLTDSERKTSKKESIQGCLGCGCLLVVLAFIMLWFLGTSVTSDLPETGTEQQTVSRPNPKHVSKEPARKTAEPETVTEKPTVISEEEPEETAGYVRSYDEDGNLYTPIRVPGGIQVSVLPGGSYRWAFRKPYDDGIETGTANANSIEDVRAVAAKEYNRLLAEVQEQAEEESTTPDLPFYSSDLPLRPNNYRQIRVHIERGAYTREEVEQIAIVVTRKYGLGNSLVHFFGSRSCITKWDKDEGGVDEWERHYWLCRVAVDSEGSWRYSSLKRYSSRNSSPQGYLKESPEVRKSRSEKLRKEGYEIRKFSAHYYGPNPVGAPDWGDRALR